MNLEQLGIDAAPPRKPGLVARLARLFRVSTADEAPAPTAPPDAAYTGPERRSGVDRRATRRSGPDRRA